LGIQGTARSVVSFNFSGFNDRQTVIEYSIGK
jgi:hypothetical protein